ncbi:MAG: hypothetical protein ACM3VS_03000 [Candidatus Dadabacteria bacterium]
MFERTGDANLDTLIQVVKTIAQAKQTIINLNALKIEEEDLP